jgi:hypothetical protein
VGARISATSEPPHERAGAEASPRAYARDRRLNGRGKAATTLRLRH